MKYLLISFFLHLFSLCSFSQNIPSNDIEEKDIKIPANVSDWYSTGIRVRKNDLVFLNVYGKISVGPIAGEVNGTGNRDNPFLVAYSWYKDIPHAALICSNDDERVFAQYKSDLQNNNSLFDCVSQSFSFSDNLISNLFTDDYIGNFFQPKSDEELKLLINDARYVDNYGSFNVSIIIYHNFFPQAGDVIIYWKNGVITHSGYVTEVDGCKVVKYNCYSTIEKTVLEGISPDDDRMKRYGYWTAYHTDRPDQRIIDKKNYLLGGEARIDGITDEKNLIIMTPILGRNCHGYTFTSWWTGWSIDGYEFPQDQIIHNNTDPGDDQGIATEFILRDNGYHETHAAESENCIIHFKPDYEVANFAVNLPEPQSK